MANEGGNNFQGQPHAPDSSADADNYPGGGFALLCVMLPMLIILYLFWPLKGLILENWSGLGASFMLVVTFHLSLLLLIVAIVLKIVSSRRGRRFSGWWMLPSIVAFLEHFAIAAGAIWRGGG